jgi:Zn-finger protein
MTDFGALFIQFQDHLAPRLDVYELALYLFIARHTIALGQSEATIGFKSARKKMATGIGTAGSPPSENTIYEKLKSLEAKGCIKVLSSERTGTRVRFFLPHEIPGVIPVAAPETTLDLEQMDFFTVAENRKLILEREGQQCFYCLASLNSENHVIEHVVSRPNGNNSYRNVVASCRQCNNRKSAETAEDFLRTLYREGLLSSEDFKARLSHLERLRAGELRPALK